MVLSFGGTFLRRYPLALSFGAILWWKLRSAMLSFAALSFGAILWWVEPLRRYSVLCGAIFWWKAYISYYCLVIYRPN